MSNSNREIHCDFRNEKNMRNYSSIGNVYTIYFYIDLTSIHEDEIKKKKLKMKTKTKKRTEKERKKNYGTQEKRRHQNLETPKLT